MPTLTLRSPDTDVYARHLRESKPDNNYPCSKFGKTSVFYYPIIIFDLTTLPDNAIISSATLTLNVTTANFEAGDADWGLYRVKRDWVDLQVTWDSYASGQSWQTAGCQGANDRESDPIGTFTPPTTTGTFDITLTPTTKAALDLGNGWTIQPTGAVHDYDYHDISTKDDATPANRPTLTIVYTLPGDAATQPAPLLRRMRH